MDPTLTVEQNPAPPKVSPIDSLKPRHEAIIDFIVLNPELPLGEVALLFKTSPAWLSTLMRSDLFKDRLASRQDKAFEGGLTSTRDRIDALATASLDRLLDRVAVETDTAKINKTAELALRAAGFLRDRPAAPGAQNNTIIVGSVDRTQLAAARALARARFPQLPAEPAQPLLEDVEVQAAAG